MHFIHDRLKKKIEMESTALPVAVDLSISHQQSCHRWTPDKVNHHVLNLKHAVSRENTEAESRFSVVSYDGNEHSDSDHKTVVTHVEAEEKEDTSCYIKTEVEDSSSSESNTSTYQKDHVLFFRNFGCSPPRTEENVFMCESENEPGQNSNSVNKVIVPSLLKRHRLGVTYEDSSELPIDLNISAKNKQNESTRVIYALENDTKLPIQMIPKLNNMEKVVFRKTSVSIRGPLSTALGLQKSHFSDLKQKKHGNNKTADSAKVIKDELQDPIPCLLNTAACESNNHKDSSACNPQEEHASSFTAIDCVIKEESLEDTSSVNSYTSQKLPVPCLLSTTAGEPNDCEDSGTHNPQEEHSSNFPAIDSVIKEESLEDTSSVNSYTSQQLSVKSEQHNGVLKDNDSDVSDGKAESGDSSDGDTHESFVNETDDSKISLDNDGEDEMDYKSVVKYPLRCAVCSRDFLYRAEYLHHCSLHESYDENILLQIANLPDPVKPEEEGLPFYCEMCGKGFMNKQAIKHHFIIHTDERPHTCNICKKSYRHRSALYKHKRSHTDVLAYACDVCGKRFKHKSYLNIHSVIHTQQRPYSCNICGSTFRDRSARNKHLHAHSGVRPYSCEVCGKCFGRKGDYKSHSVIHTEQRPYKCDVCGRGFRSSSNYHRHCRTHTTDCPYKCDICGKSFNQNWKLKEHKFVHSDKLPYVCEICGAGFKYPRKYKQHMENHARERLHNQDTAASAGQLEEPTYEVMDVQPDISVLLEQ